MQTAHIVQIALVETINSISLHVFRNSSNLTDGASLWMACGSVSLDQQVVMVSPLVRTLETASGVFGDGSVASSEPSSPLLMLPTQAQKNTISSHPAIQRPQQLSFVADESCRERVGMLLTSQTSLVT